MTSDPKFLAMPHVARPCLQIVQTGNQIDKSIAATSNWIVVAESVVSQLWQVESLLGTGGSLRLRDCFRARGASSTSSSSQLRDLLPPLRFIATALSFIVVNLISPFAQSDSIPGSYSGPWAYFSTDMSPVEVSLGAMRFDHTTGTYKQGHYEDPNNPRFVESPPIIVSLPRAFINGLHPYSSDSHEIEFRAEVLPSKARGDNVILNMTYPEGLPYSVVYQTWPQHKPDMTQPGMGARGTELVAKSDQLRTIRMQAMIVASEFPDSRRQIERILASRHGTTGSTYEGFQHYTAKPSNWEDYADNSSDEIQLVRCTAPVAKSAVSYFCSYYVPLNSRLYAKLDFLDFRLNGGRQFARRRVRAFKTVMCPIFHCDQKAIKAAKVGE